MANKMRGADDKTNEKPDDKTIDTMGKQSEEQARVHEAYSRLGRMGGEKGGQIRREQMARGEIFTRETHTHADRAPGEGRREEREKREERQEERQ